MHKVRWALLAVLLAATALFGQSFTTEGYSTVTGPQGATVRVARSGLTSADTLDYATTLDVSRCDRATSVVVVPTWSVAGATAQVHVALYDRTSDGWAWSGIAVIQTMTAVLSGLGTGSVVDTDGSTLLTSRMPAASPPMLVDTYGRPGFRVLIGDVSTGNLAYQAHSLGAVSQAATQ